MSKDKLINNEIKRLKELYKDIDRPRKLTAYNLIDEVAYMKITLRELKEQIDNDGAIDEMCQGSYTILREHPALKAYNTMVQRYTTTVKQLMDQLPKEVQQKAEDTFDEFVNSRTE